MKLKLSLDITLQYVIYIFGVIHASSKIDSPWDLRNSSDDTKAELNNCLIICSKEFLI